MPTRRRRAPDSQLVLPFPETTRPPSALAVHTGELIALNDAVRLLLGVAEGRVGRSAEALAAVHRALAVVAAHRPRGRLGHVVRRYGAQPVTAVRWAELADELAFVLSLAPHGEAPEPAPTEGGIR